MANTRSSTAKAVARRTAPSAWQHTPTRWTLLWMAISLPLVAWDTVYVLGRPHTMEGGAIHWPMYVPYRLYAEVDHVYGWKAFNANEGFTGAQGFLNLIESIMYVTYLWIVLRRGEPRAGATTQRVVDGRMAAWAVLVGFSAAVMTLSKTALYWLIELFGNFSNIGHNPMDRLVFLWIIPNGAWLLGSGYMIWSLGSEIVDGLALASGTKED
ncbi:hypothetical protein B0I35DRAFT_420228 [Stachybotrys elegans]|uniref:EXPERA domain-containing protein n=1 Tax=Stachybotrys elegans TaxID=80388 RepID=A0A8K0T0G0_9HYPO|nr:hypothetical protein B0I35DRAFT_420228 [Stachybotrys elegans]